MTAQETRTEIQSLVVALLRSELAIDINSPVIRQEGDVRWVVWPSAPFPQSRIGLPPFGTMADYRRLLEYRQYNVVLFDGALLMAFSEFRRNQLVKQSLTYYPCPIGLPKQEEPLLESIGEIIDNTLLGSLENVEWLTSIGELSPFGTTVLRYSLLMRAPLRFDFQPEAEAALHPSSHLHFGDPNCRIPVYAPISFAAFARFIFRNYYTDKWLEHSFLQALPARNVGRCISPGHEIELFFECLDVEQRRAKQRHSTMLQAPRQRLRGRRARRKE